MAFKLNLKPELEKQVEALLEKTEFRSKTEFINQAVEEFTDKIKRQQELEKLKDYFKKYKKDGQKILKEFAELRAHHDKY